MRRVRTIHALRALAPILSGLAVFLVALYGIGREVWVAQVFKNVFAVAGTGNAARYVANAFIHTDLLVQMLSLIALAGFAWLMVGLIRNLQSFTRLV